MVLTQPPAGASLSHGLASTERQQVVVPTALRRDDPAQL